MAHGPNQTVAFPQNFMESIRNAAGTKFAIIYSCAGHTLLPQRKNSAIKEIVFLLEAAFAFLS